MSEIYFQEDSGEFSFEIRDKESIRKLKKLFKTKKENLEEKRYNKEKFREFIKKF